jgi:hypothetical protein
MTLTRLFRALAFRITGRIDCAPRLDPMAPYPDEDCTGGFPIVVEPMSTFIERVWWGPDHHQWYLRYTRAWHVAEGHPLPARKHVAPPRPAPREFMVPR